MGCIARVISPLFQWSYGPRTGTGPPCRILASEMSLIYHQWIWVIRLFSKALTFRVCEKLKIKYQFWTDSMQKLRLLSIQFGGQVPCHYPKVVVVKGKKETLKFQLWSWKRILYNFRKDQTTKNKNNFSSWWFQPIGVKIKHVWVATTQFWKVHLKQKLFKLIWSCHGSPPGPKISNPNYLKRGWCSSIPRSTFRLHHGKLRVCMVFFGKSIKITINLH